MQVLEQLDKLFCYDDVLSYVEIWDRKHACKILKVINQVFGDIGNAEQYLPEHDASQYLHDDFDINQWGELLEDDSSFELAIENLSLDDSCDQI